MSANHFGESAKYSKQGRVATGAYLQDQLCKIHAEVMII
jgi:hypothetical protein